MYVVWLRKLLDGASLFISESALALSKVIRLYKLKTLLSLLPLFYRFSEGYSELLHLQRREEDV